MKNSQVAVLCGAILAGALIVAGDQCLARAIARSTRPAMAPAAARSAAAALVIAMMPKAKGDPYFVSCRAGAEEAAQRARRRADLGRPDRARRRAAERDGRELDHAGRRRDCRRGRKPRGHLDGSAQGARAAASRS